MPFTPVNFSLAIFLLLMLLPEGAATCRGEPLPAVRAPPALVNSLPSAAPLEGRTPGRQAAGFP